MLSLSSRLPNIGTSIFTVMSKLAADQGAINLSQGFPDFDCPPELVELVYKYMREGHNQYAPMAGVATLREQIAAKTNRLHGANYDADTEVTVTSGGTQALFTALCAVIRPGDEVIIFEPAYDSYVPSIEMLGGRAIPIALSPPDYRIDWQQVRKVVTAHTRVILINSPHNPSGSILREEDIRELIAITRDTNILILSDEVYEHLVFDGAQHLSMARYPELRERSFIAASFGKLFHTTGWKLGYCIACSELMVEFRKAHQFIVFSANTPMQYAAAEYLRDESVYLHLASFFQDKRDHFRSLMQNTKFSLLPSRGSYFQAASFAEISDEKDVDFARRLTIDFKVACIPVSVFYTRLTDHRIVRFCFAKKNETLEIAAERLLKV